MRRPFTRSRARFRRIEQVIEYLAYALIVFYALFSLAHWLSERAFLQIERIEVRGAGAVDAEEVASIARKPLSGRLVYRWIEKNNAVLYPSSEVTRAITESSGWIDDVRVRAGRHSVSISLVEHIPTFHWCPDDERAVGPIPADACWYADQDGRVFIPSPAYSGYPLVRIVGDDQGTSTARGTYIMEPSSFEHIRALIGVLEREGIRVRSVAHIENADYRIRSDMPWDILWEMTDDIDGSAQALVLAVRDMEERPKDQPPILEVDLRFDGKVFFR